MLFWRFSSCLFVWLLLSGNILCLTLLILVLVRFRSDIKHKQRKDELDFLSFGHSLRRGQLAMNSHSFPSSENFLISFSLLKGNFTRYSICILVFIVDSSFLSAFEKRAPSLCPPCFQIQNLLSFELVFLSRWYIVSLAVVRFVSFVFSFQGFAIVLVWICLGLPCIRFIEFLKTLLLKIFFESMFFPL